MAGKLIICLSAAFALIQPFNTLPAASPAAAPASITTPDVIYRNAKGDYYTKDGTVLTDQYPIFFRQTNSVEPKNVVVVEPTITYQAETAYTSTQSSPATTTFRAAAREGQSDFRPIDGRTYEGRTYEGRTYEGRTYEGRTESGRLYQYPYYIRAPSNDRNDIEERRRIEEGKRIVIDPTTDPTYQRFVQRDGAVRDGGQTWYYYSERPGTSSSSAPPPIKFTPRIITDSKSAVRFYYSNGTEITTHNEDGRQVMNIHPNRYVIQVTEITSTTPRPDYSFTDCPPYHPCNRVVYQDVKCCKCFILQPTSCCPCPGTYTGNGKK